MKLIMALVASLVVLSATATPLQFISLGKTFPSDTGGGFSAQPIISADGRHVLFSSTADNLALSTNNTPSFLPLNVYLRDRASNTTFQVSVDWTGIGGGDDDSVPTGLADDGNFLLFDSRAGNLVAGDTNRAWDVFVRDLTNATTLLVSANTNGGCANGESYNSVCTPDCRYVAFTSAASDLVADDTNGISDVFVRDLHTGTTRCVSVGAKSSNGGSPNLSDMPAITADGRYIAFFSSATNLVPGLTNAGEIYVRDLIAQTTVWASVDALSLLKSVTGQTSAVSCNPNISADGNYVAFETLNSFSSNARGIVLRYCLSSGQTDLVYTNALSGNADTIQNLNMSADGQSIAFVANIGTAGATAIYSWNAQTGTAVPVSVNTNNEMPAVSYCDNPVISSNGQYVTFLANAAGLTTNALTANAFHLYVRNLQSGKTTLVDGALLSGGETGAGMSADGSVIAFGSNQENLVANDHNRNYDVFVRDLRTATTELISARHPSLPSLSANGLSIMSAQALTADGHYVAFASEADDLVDGDTNQASDVFVHDLYTGSNILVSATDAGSVGSGASFEPAISGDGRFVAFTSFATNLCAGDATNKSDVFVRDLQAETTFLVSINTSGTAAGNNASYSPTISSDGRFVLFLSKATDVASGLVSGYENLLLRDRQNAVTYALTTKGQGAASMTPDGHFIAYTATSGSDLGKIFLWDTQVAKRIATNYVTAYSLSISPDGNSIAYSSVSSPLSLCAWDRIGNRTSTIASRASFRPRFSASGAFLTYTTPLNGWNQVYLYNFQDQTSTLVSHQTNSTSPANDISDSPDISADGRFVVYRSWVSDIVSGHTNRVSDIVLFDSMTGKNTILSSGRLGSFNNLSFAPVFSGDGRTLLFQSWGANLMPGDFNQSVDLFAYAFLYAGITSDTENHPVISWPAAPNQVYSVEYKDQLTDAIWHPVSGPVTIIGNRGFLTNSAPASALRFYRVSSTGQN